VKLEIPAGLLHSAGCERVAAVATFSRVSVCDEEDEGDDMKQQRWIRCAGMGFCLSIALACGFAPVASAQQDSDQPPSDNPQCTDENLQGRYGYSTSGWLVGLRPVATVGVLTFDGEGILKAQYTSNNSGVFSRRTGVGTYFVNANCTGSATVAGDFAGLSFDFTIVPGTDGSEFSLIVTNSGTVETGDAHRIPDEECTDATVQGIYRLHAHGYLLGTGPSASVGIRIVDGAGNLSGHDTVSTNGLIQPRDVLSTYNVNSDCTGTQTWTDGRTFDWVIVAGGTQVFFIRTDHPGIMIASGTFKKQSHSRPTPDNDGSADKHSDND
jgi:hypothetical protein